MINLLPSLADQLIPRALEISNSSVIADGRVFSEFLSSIKQHARGLIRLGDGEAKIIAYPRHTDFNIVARQLKIWFGDRIFSHDEILAIRAELIEAIRNCATLGIPTPARLSAKNPDGSPANDALLCAAMLVELVDHLNIDFAGKQIGSASMHLEWHASGRVKEFISSAGKIVFICRTQRAPQALKELRLIDDYLWLPVPGESWSRAESVSIHYPEVYAHIKSTIRTLTGCHRALVGAGVLGKVYIDLLQQSNISSLDVGSLIDVWANDIPRQRASLKSNIRLTSSSLMKGR